MIIYLIKKSFYLKLSMIPVLTGLFVSGCIFVTRCFITLRLRLVIHDTVSSGGRGNHFHVINMKYDKLKFE